VACLFWRALVLWRSSLWAHVSEAVKVPSPQASSTWLLGIECLQEDTRLEALRPMGWTQGWVLRRWLWPPGLSPSAHPVNISDHVLREDGCIDREVSRGDLASGASNTIWDSLSTASSPNGGSQMSACLSVSFSFFPSLFFFFFFFGGTGA
jgi:hypothetical protein